MSNWKKVIVVTLISIWFGLMSFSSFKVSSIPELRNPKLITEQIAHYSPYGELIFLLMLIALIAVINVDLHQKSIPKNKN